MTSTLLSAHLSILLPPLFCYCFLPVYFLFQYCILQLWLLFIFSNSLLKKQKQKPSCIISVCASICFLRPWIIFMISTLKLSQVDCFHPLHIAVLLRFLSCSFVWNIFLHSLILSKFVFALLCMWKVSYISQLWRSGPLEDISKQHSPYLLPQGPGTSGPMVRWVGLCYHFICCLTWGIPALEPTSCWLVPAFGAKCQTPAELMLMNAP